MADSIAPVAVTAIKTNIFIATGISQGSGLYVENIGGGNIYAAISPSEPSNELAVIIRSGESYQLSEGESGLWVWCENSSSALTVQEV
jgi:hypothetical protein